MEEIKKVKIGGSMFIKKVVCVLSLFSLVNNAIGQTWTDTKGPTDDRQGPNNSVLTDGRFMVIGSVGSTTGTTTYEIYDPATGLWSGGAAPSGLLSRESSRGCFLQGLKEEACIF